MTATIVPFRPSTKPRKTWRYSVTCDKHTTNLFEYTGCFEGALRCANRLARERFPYGVRRQITVMDVQTGEIKRIGL